MVHKKIWLLCVVLCLCACDNERAIRPSFIGGSSFTHDPISFPEEWQDKYLVLEGVLSWFFLP